jgi:hypothetical protein
LPIACALPLKKGFRRVPLGSSQRVFYITGCVTSRCQIVALRDMRSLDGCRSLSGQSGHGWTCYWLDPVANDPKWTSTCQRQKQSGLKKAEAQSSSSPGWRPLQFRSIVLTDQKPVPASFRERALRSPIAGALAMSSLNLNTPLTEISITSGIASEYCFPECFLTTSGR